ncbi:MAG: hypothetical protein ACK5LL_13470 [Suipraeoptans sp.]
MSEMKAMKRLFLLIIGILIFTNLPIFSRVRPTNKMAIVAILIVACGIIGYYFIIEPIYRTLNNIAELNIKRKIELSVAKEHLKNVKVLTKALVHDLKGPIYNSMLKNELKLMSEGEKHSEREREALVGYINHSHELISKVNTILKELMDEIDQSGSKTTELDIVNTIQSVKEQYVSEMIKKKIDFKFETPKEERIYQDKIGLELLIDNVFSNMIHHAEEHSEVCVTLERIGNVVELVTKNYCKLETATHTQDETYPRSEYQYSSGYGQSLIEGLTKRLDVTYTYALVDNVVISTLHIPVQYKKEHKMIK